jgi:hypothetical protein
MLRRMLPVTGRLHSLRSFGKVAALRNITPVNELHLGASADNVEKYTSFANSSLNGNSVQFCEYCQYFSPIYLSSNHFYFRS